MKRLKVELVCNLKLHCYITVPDVIYVSNRRLNLTFLRFLGGSAWFQDALKTSV